MLRSNPVSIKYQLPKNKQIINTKNENSKKYGLEDRTLEFANNVRLFVRKIKRTVGNLEDSKQLVRSSGSIGANYIEANEALSKKDFLMRMRISRKEAKESRYWLDLLDLDNDVILKMERDKLMKESTELIKIFSSIVSKSSI